MTKSIPAPLRAGAVALALLAPVPAQSTTIDAASLKLLLAGGGEIAIDLAIEILVGAIEGSRGAAAVAKVKSYGESDSAGCPGWGCNTGEVKAHADDDKGVADAWASNNPPGGAARGTRAKATGKIAAAKAAITWNGKIKASAVSGAPFAGFGLAAAAALPAAEDVQSAVATLSYSFSDIDASAEGAYGLWAFSHAWNGVTSFDGEISFDALDPIPDFTGDLAGYEALFTTEAGLIETSGLAITDTVSFEIDYADFLMQSSFTADFSGEMTAEAATVPLPASLALALSGLLALAARARLSARLSGAARSLLRRRNGPTPA